MELRHYQESSVSSLFDWFGRRDGNPLIVLPTGTGKSVVIAEFMRRAIADWPQTRMVMATHKKELIGQNYQELVRLWQSAPAGIYSAGLRRRDMQSQILMCGIQSVAKRAYGIQRCDLVLIDEAHTVPHAEKGGYRQFLADLRVINPHLRVVGLTATPYRLKGGLLHQGENRLFDGIAYEYPIGDAIREGFLCPVTTVATDAEIDTSGVASAGGDFVARALERASNRDNINRAVVAEMLARGADRRCWLVFCAGVAHAEAIRDMLRAAGVSCEAITEKTGDADRARFIAGHQRGTLQCLTNADVLTTGYNNPRIDLIGMTRATKSVGLYVQMVGRGTRLHGSKSDCLVLDFARNIDRHGPIDAVNAPRPPGKAGGDAPVKDCPACGEELHASARLCEHCGYAFEFLPAQIDAQASRAAILSAQVRPEWLAVTEVRYTRHEKADSPPSMRVTYHCGLQSYSEWICFQHTGLPRQKACAWWQLRSGGAVPLTVVEAMRRSAEVARPSAIMVRKVGKYHEVINHQLQQQEFSL